MLYTFTNLDTDLVVLFHVKADDLSARFSGGREVISDSHTLSLLIS